VGSVNGTTLVLEGAYAELPLYTEDALDGASDVAGLGITLNAYTAMGKFSPDHTAVTSERGMAKSEGMAEGVYLMTSEKLSLDGDVFVTDPQLIILPQRTSEDAAIQRSVTLEPKYSRLGGDDGKVTVKVLKKWDDNGNENSRPAELKISLLRDGELYDTVSLTSEKNWRHTWDDLDGSAVWSVVEEVPEDYKVMIHREGITRVITNSKDTPPPPPPREDDKLPQTGILLWPIPVLAIGGIAMIGAGIATMKGKENEA